MKYSVTLSLALLGTIGAYGQEVRLEAGPRLGLNLGMGTYSTMGRAWETKPGLRGEIGGTVSLSRGHWDVQVSGLFAQKGFRVDEEDYGGISANMRYMRMRRNYRLDYFTVPVNLAYRLRPDGQGLQVFAGGYAGRLLGGRFSYDDVSELEWEGEMVRLAAEGRAKVGTTNVYSESSQSGGPIYLRPWDVGVQGGVGYRHQRLLVQLSYSRGLRDLGPVYRDIDPRFIRKGPSYKLRGVQLAATYLLGKAN